MALPAFAAVLPTILATLDKWSEWSRIKAGPDRIDALEARIAALEGGPASPRPALTAPTKAPGRPCPACGEFAMRRTAICLDATRTDVSNAKLETWTCASCSDEDEIEVPPRK